MDIEVEHFNFNTVLKHFKGLQTVTLYLSCHLHSHIVNNCPELTKVPYLRITAKYAHNAQNTQICPQVPKWVGIAQSAPKRPKSVQEFSEC